MIVGFFKIAAASLLLLGSVAACSNSKPEVAAGTGDKNAKADASDSGNDDEGEGEGPGGDDEGNGTSDFSGCGIKSFAALKSFSQQTSSAEIPYHGSGGSIFSSEYKIKVKGTVGFQVTATGVTLSNDFQLISADPPNAANKAQDELKKVIGQRAAELLDAGGWENFTSQWGGVTCGVIPVTKITEQTQTHQTVIQFDPPLPYFVSPVMTKDRFEKEFPEQRQFSGIKATVLQSTNPKAKAGATSIGTVFVRPVAADTTIVENDGTQVKVDADYAFRLDFDFGNFEQTAALGLNKLSTFYVKDGKFFAVSIETGVQQAMTIHYTK